MAKKKVCCSFDYEHDRIYYNLLEGWNENNDIEYSSAMKPPFQSVGYWYSRDGVGRVQKCL